MNTEQVTKINDELYKISARIINGQEQHDPIMMVFDNEAMPVTVLNCESLMVAPVGPALVDALLRKVAATPGIGAAVFISEAWMKEIQVKHPAPGEVHTAEQVKEVLQKIVADAKSAADSEVIVVRFLDHSRTQWVAMHQIERYTDSNGKEFRRLKAKGAPIERQSGMGEEAVRAALGIESSSLLDDVLKQMKQVLTDHDAASDMPRCEHEWIDIKLPEDGSDAEHCIRCHSTRGKQKRSEADIFLSKGYIHPTPDGVN